MTEPAVLADHLDQQSEAILAHWRTTVEQDRDVPEANRLSRSEFLDHIPALLERLAERLRGLPSDPAREGQRHGEHRWRQGYDLAEIVTEFGHLRSALRQSSTEFARANHWSLERFEAALAAIDDVLDEATAESVRQFQEDSQAESQQALAELKTRQRAIEDAWVSAKLERSKLRTILRSLPVAVWVVDGDGTIIGSNDAAERLLGFDPVTASAEPTNVHNLGPEYQITYHDGTICPHDALPVIRALRGEVVSQEEYAWVLQGVTRNLSINATPLTDTDGAVVGAVVAVVDLTAHKRFEAALEQQKALAEDASQHKTRLVSALSHDVRTPLNAVVLAAQLLDVHLDGSSDSEVQECLRTIRHSVRNVLDLLGDLLDLSKLDAGATPQEVSRFPLEPVLAECLASIEPQARQKGLDVRLEPGPLAGVSFETDRSKLKQVLANLLSNALRYTDRGRVRLYGERVDDRVRIVVEDTGIGIAPDDQSRIFEEFAMLDHPHRPPGEGTGLGLAICRRLSSLLGGTIQLRSTPGVGSTFVLDLPASVLTLTAPAAIEIRGASGGFDGAGAVLIAEDHPDSRHTLARFLRRMGFRVLEAGNGRDALTAARQEPDLRVILMDVNMPEMDGVEATLALRADPRLTAVPIFALTGDVTVGNQHRIAEAGVNGYLEKPVTWDALREALDSVGPRTERE